MDINAVGLVGITANAELATELEVAVAENLKWVRRAPTSGPGVAATPALDAMTDLLELKTVWRPIGV